MIARTQNPTSQFSDRGPIDGRGNHLGHNECPEHSQCTNLFDGKGDILAGGYSCWCEEGYEYITHKIDLDTVDGSVTGSVPLRDRLVCNDIDECITLYPCNGMGLDSFMMIYDAVL